MKSSSASRQISFCSHTNPNQILLKIIENWRNTHYTTQLQRGGEIYTCMCTVGCTAGISGSQLAPRTVVVAAAEEEEYAATPSPFCFKCPFCPLLSWIYPTGLSLLEKKEKYNHSYGTRPWLCMCQSTATIFPQSFLSPIQY